MNAKKEKKRRMDERRTEVTKGAWLSSKSLLSVDVVSALDSTEWQKIFRLNYFTPWAILVTVCIYIQIFIVLYEIEAVPSRFPEWKPGRLWFLLREVSYYVYLADAIVAMVYSSVPSIYESYIYIRRPTYQRALDVIAVLKFDLIMAYSPESFLKIDDHTERILRANRILMLHRVVAFLHDLELGCKLSRTKMFILTYLSMILIILHIIQFIWLMTGIFAPKHSSWMKKVAPLEIERTELWQWYALCESNIVAMLTGHSRGFMVAASTYAWIFMMAVWTIGLVLQFGFLLGGFISVIIVTSFRRFANYESMASTSRFLKALNLSDDLQQRCTSYYTTLWTKYSGVKRSLLFPDLPLAWRKECLVDVYWEAMRHSRLFSCQPIPFKRSLSLCFECTFHLPGHLIFRKGMVKDKMVYLVRGIVEMMSVEDPNTAVASFTSGTILGEASLFYHTISPSDVRCVTFCEVQILTVQKLVNALQHYPAVTKSMTDALRARVRRAMRLQRRANAAKRAARLASGGFAPSRLTNPEDFAAGDIRWVKERWRNVQRQQVGLNEKRLQDTLRRSRSMDHEAARKAAAADASALQEAAMRAQKRENVGLEDELANLFNSCRHSSTYLDMLALTPQRERDVEMMCLTSKWPWIIEPTSDFVVFWQTLMIFVVLFDIFVMPYYISFREDYPHIISGLGILSDIMVIADMYVKLTTAVRTSRGTEIKFLDILLSQMRRHTFFLELIALVPMHHILSAIYGKKQGMPFRMVRMLYVHKLSGLGDYLGRKAVESAWFLVFKYIVFAFSGAYWVACCLVFLNSNSQGTGWYANVLYNRVKSSKYYGNTMFTDYFETGLSLLLRVTSYTTGNVSVSDMVLSLVVSLLGQVLFTYAMGLYTAATMLNNRRTGEFLELMRCFQHFKHETNMPKSVYSELEGYLRHQFKMNGALHLLNDTWITNPTPGFLASEVAATWQRMLCEIPIFSRCDEEFIIDLAHKVRVYELPPRTTLTRGGQYPVALYFLRKGHCNVVSHVVADQDRCLRWRLDKEECFPLIEVLHKRPSLLSVRTQTSVVIALIRRGDFLAVLSRHPTVKTFLFKLAQRHETERHISTLEGILSADKKQKHRRRKLERKWKHAQKRRRCGRSPESMSRSDTMDTVFDEMQDDNMDDNDESEKDDDDVDWEDETSNDEENDKFVVDSRVREEAYERAWAKMGKILRCIRAFGCRRLAWDPTGKFVRRWEAVRVGFALAGSFLIPLAYGGLSSYMWLRLTIKFVIDLISYIDIIIRFQVGYFNAEGILITHPAMTARHYFCHGFLPDLVCCAPFELMYIFFNDDGILQSKEDNRAKFYFYAHLFRCVQFYRVYKYLSYREQCDESQRQFTFTYRIVLIMVLLCNLMANILVHQYCTTFADQWFTEWDVTCLFEELLEVSPVEGTTEITSSFDAFVVTNYRILALLTGIHDTSFKDASSDERYTTVLISFIAFLLRMMILANIISIFVGKRTRLSRYRIQLSYLLQFLRKQEVSEEMIYIVVESFEYQWLRRRGFNVQVLLSMVHPQLREDVSYHRGWLVFKNVPVFEDADPRFFRALSKSVRAHYYPRGRRIIGQNEVQNLVYIIDFGLVEVRLPGSDDVVCTLNKGALFGNLRCRHFTRHMLQMHALHHTTCLVCQGDQLMDILDRFPQVKERLNDLIGLQPEFIESMRFGDSDGFGKRMWDDGKRGKVERKFMNVFRKRRKSFTFGTKRQSKTKNIKYIESEPSSNAVQHENQQPNGKQTYLQQQDLTGAKRVRKASRNSSKKDRKSDRQSRKDLQRAGVRMPGRSILAPPEYGIRVLEDHSHTELRARKPAAETLESLSAKGIQEFKDKTKKVVVGTVSFLFCNFFIPLDLHLVMAGFALQLGDDKTWLTLFYAIDFMFVIKMIMFCFLPFQDPHTGQIIKDKKTIANRYLKSPRHFPLDFASTVPLEVIGYAFMRFGYAVPPLAMMGMRLNRALRMINLIKVSVRVFNRLSSRLCLRVIHFAQWSLLGIMFMTCFYIIVECTPEPRCYFLRDPATPTSSSTLTKDKPETFILALFFIVSETLTGDLYEPPFQTVRSAFLRHIRALLIQAIFTTCSAYLAYIMYAATRRRADARFLGEGMRLYLHDLELSSALQQRVNLYVKLLWRTESGLGLPELMDFMDRDLRITLMSAMFMKYLQRDMVLGRAHQDLLKQMCLYLKRYIFFPGDVVTALGDVDDCFYILQNGVIEAVERMTFYRTRHVMFIYTGVFGLMSGLFPLTPHKYTYRAHHKSEVLSLHRKDWEYLIDYFPSAQVDIFDYAREIEIPF